MKLLGKILLTIIFVLTFLVFVLSINIRYQLLSSNFWIDAFRRDDIYFQMSQIISNKFTKKVIDSGGSKSDVTVLANLVSPSTIGSFFEENVKSILAYANNTSSEIIVYVPFSFNGLNGDSDLQNVENNFEKMRLQDFVGNFNIKEIKESDIKMIPKIGLYSWILMFCAFTFLLFIFTLIYLLVEAGKRLTALGTPLVLSGMLILSISYICNYVGKIITEGFAQSENIATSLAAIAILPVIHGVSAIWVWFGVSFIGLGVLLFFIKKPAINKAK